jgi:site-specific DNA recombinase
MPSTISGHGPQSEWVALYLRVSSEEQRDRETIEIQREFLEQYRSLYELEVASVYEDDGVSGTVPLHERPEGRRLLEDASEGKFQTVLVYKLDRLGRSLLVIVDAHDRLQEAGAALRSATEPIDTSTPSGRLIFQMLASFAEYERGTIRERTRAGLHRAFRDGRYMGRVPYGYRANENGRLEIEPEEADIVQEIIGNVAAGATLYSQATRLNDLGVPAPGWRYGNSPRKPGRGWSVMTISKIVRQRAYSGVHEVRVNDGRDLIEQEVPAIVSPELQERAKAVLAENKRRPDRQGDRDYLLSGLIKCAVCGSACTGHSTSTRGRKYHYYVCFDGRGERFRKGPPKHAPYVSASWLENMICEDVKRFLENPGEVLERVREQATADDATAELEARREELGKRLASKSVEKDRYVRAYAQGHISEDELAEYATDLNNQTNNLRLLLESVEDKLARRREHVEVAETTEAWLMTLRERVSEIEEDTEEAHATRRELVRFLVERIITGRDEDGCTRVEVVYRFGPPEPSGDEDAFVGGVTNSTPL